MAPPTGPRGIILSLESGNIEAMISALLPRRPNAQIAVLLLGVLVGLFVRELVAPSRGDEHDKSRTGRQASRPREGSHLAPDTAAAYDPQWDRPYPQYQPVGDVLKPMPNLKPGEICPQDLSIFGGRGRTSYGSIDDVADFEPFCRMCMENKPRIMDERRKYMEQRYDFTGAVTTEVTMTRGKPVPVGPVARLPKGVANWCELASLDPEEIRRRDLFPLGFRPLSHPLHTVGHQLFPAMWLKFHPEHERFDVDFDIPETLPPRVSAPALPHHAPGPGRRLAGA